MFSTIVKTGSTQYQIYGIPDTCPFCHKSIMPLIIASYLGDKLQVFMHCPNDACKKAFVAYYNPSGGTFHYGKETTIGTLNTRSFSSVIEEISKSFIEIYNQAYIAEQHNLLEICGVGYRKSLEYLIKDYVIKENPEKEENIKSLPLAKCISEYVNDSRVKTVSKRAIWLGNDETHYQRKWEGKTLLDLKNLIDLTLHWIEMEKLTEKFQTEMPDSI